MKRALMIWISLFTLIVGAQDSQTLRKLQFDQSKINPQFTMPEMPMTVIPSTNIKPTFNTNPPSTDKLKPDYRMNGLADSLAIYQQDWSSGNRPALPRFHYDTNPYGHDWSSGGYITRVGGGYLTGAGSHTTYLGLGNETSASIAFTMPMGERLTIAAGLSGSKYHFDRSAWNDYGVFGSASFKLSDKFSLNAFGQYFIDQRYHSIATMPFLGSASYGGTLGWRANNHFSLDVGARRIYDPYTGMWRTLPIVQPTINLLGAPISFDAGPLLYHVLDYIFGGDKKNRDWGDPRYRPVAAPDAMRNQPGFNPNSPVPIPDAFRH